MFRRIIHHILMWCWEIIKPEILADIKAIIPVIDLSPHNGVGVASILDIPPAVLLVRTHHCGHDSSSWATDPSTGDRVCMDCYNRIMEER